MADWLTMSVRRALDGPSGRFNLDVEFGVEKGAFVALVGPSGAGKTTLLRILAGLTTADAGRIVVDGVCWYDTSARRALPTRHRSIGLVFQDYALFPNMTVKENIEYALGRKAPPARINELLELVELEQLHAVRPARLSGGQKQRLALVRSLASQPSILLLDEPLSALDRMMRRRLQDEIRKMHHAFGTTTFLVSHDLSEILRLADRVISMEEGRIAFDGAPNAFVGAGTAQESLCIVADHIDGPDDNKMARVRIGTDLHSIRYAAAPDTLHPGDTVLLDVETVRVRRAL